MRKYILLFTIVIFAILISCFFLKLKTNFKEEFIHFLDKDIIYQKDGKIIEGWLWEEKNVKIVAGKDVEGNLFAIPLSECKKIKKDAFLTQLKITK